MRSDRFYGVVAAQHAAPSLKVTIKARHFATATCRVRCVDTAQHAAPLRERRFPAFPFAGFIFLRRKAALLRANGLILGLQAISPFVLVALGSAWAPSVGKEDRDLTGSTLL